LEESTTVTEFPVGQVMIMADY